MPRQHTAGPIALALLVLALAACAPPVDRDALSTAVAGAVDRLSSGPPEPATPTPTARPPLVRTIVPTLPPLRPSPSPAPARSGPGALSETPAPIPTRLARATGYVLAKYYAWFDADTWVSGTLSDQPVAPYLSAERATIERQVRQAQGVGIDGFTLNWWGADNPTDANLQTLLAVARRSAFAVTVDVDLNSPFWTGPDDLASALTYLRRYFEDPAWLRLGGRPVVSFYGTRKYDLPTWRAIRRRVDSGGEALWIGEGDLFEYLAVFDGIHPYSVAWSPDPAAQLASYASRTRAAGSDKLWVATVMPGYDDTRLGRRDGFKVDRQGGAYYRRMWRGAIATRPAIVSITSWNEWPEGSYIEPSQLHGDLYLRLTREMVDAYRATLP
ncbi:MAG TPA: endo-1,3-alpha-glucanase family glycosylhydrolase [Chloroflexota bacterium]